MRACHVMVLPSFEEGSALVTYEGRACGCVLVISDRAGAPAEDGVDALVHAAGDGAALTGHLRALADVRRCSLAFGRRASSAPAPHLGRRRAGRWRTPTGSRSAAELPWGASCPPRPTRARADEGEERDLDEGERVEGEHARRERDMAAASATASQASDPVRPFAAAVSRRTALT